MRLSPEPQRPREDTEDKTEEIQPKNKAALESIEGADGRDPSLNEEQGAQAAQQGPDPSKEQEEKNLEKSSAQEQASPWEAPVDAEGRTEEIQTRNEVAPGSIEDTDNEDAFSGEKPDPQFAPPDPNPLKPAKSKDPTGEKPDSPVPEKPDQPATGLDASPDTPFKAPLDDSNQIPDPSKEQEEKNLEKSSAQEQASPWEAPVDPEDKTEEVQPNNDAATEVADGQNSSSREELDEQFAPPDPDSRKASESQDPAGGKADSPIPEKPDQPAANQDTSHDTPFRAPSERGGMRDRSLPDPKPDPVPRKEPLFRPGLICRKRPGMPWEIVLSANDECRITKVLYAGKSLEIENAECSLSSFTGRLSVSFEGGGEVQVPLFENKHLIFKLAGKSEEGRRIKKFSKGRFLVVAPKDDQLKESESFEPEHCADEDFLAHRRYLDGSESVSGLKLKGDRIFDDSPHGDLFAGEVPDLECPRDVVWARAGEENGWKGQNFKPAEETLSSVLDGRQGRFFVRIYDDRGELLDSEEFRYLRDLKEISVNGEPYGEDTLLLPPPSGHAPAEVRFVGRNGAVVSPVLKEKEPHAAVRNSSLIIDPHPDADGVSCTLETDIGKVDVALKVSRIWWRLDQGDGSKWRSAALAMTRKEFRRHAEENAAIRLRLPRKIKLNAGFDNGMDQKYSTEPNEDETRIPLDDFAEYPQIEQRLNEDIFFNVQFKKTEPLTLIRISADPAIVSFKAKPERIAAGEKTTLRWSTRNAEPGSIEIAPEIGAVDANGSLKIRPADTTTYTITLKASDADDMTMSADVVVAPLPRAVETHVAWVKNAHRKYRSGKGFSRLELSGAGLTAADAARHSVPVDSRRRSMHEINIETLRSLN